MNGKRVTTLPRIGDTRGMLIDKAALLTRRCNADGVVMGWVPGHGGDVWWVKHDADGSIAPYCFDEWVERS